MSLPYFNMYPTDFEAKTSHLTMAEDGAYNRLLRLMWMTPGCSLPDDDKWIMRRMRCTQDEFDTVVSVVIDEFFERKNGRLSNARLAREFTKSSDAHKKRVSAGSKGGKAKALQTNNKPSSNAKAMPKQPEPEPEPDIKGDTKVSLVIPDNLDDAYEIYNLAASEVGWPRMVKRSKARDSHLRARMKEVDGIGGWSAAIDKAKASQFLTGQTSKPFFASFDWIANQANFTKIMEGNYDNRTVNGFSGPSASNANDATLESIARAARAR